MSFLSYTFALLVLVLLCVRLAWGKNHNEPAFLWALIAASALFYAWHIPKYFFILLFVTVLDFSVARLVVGGRRPWLLALSILANFALLGVFKYADFFIDGLESVLFAWGKPLGIGPLGLVLPLGISFFTFHSMSYTIDAYRGVIAPLPSYSRFFLFVSFFPQMMAGPILRAKEFLPQFARRRRLHWKVMTEGVFLVARGLFLKMVVADNLSLFVDEYWAASSTASVRWLVTLYFAAQIFCDFEGYCSIARGLGYWLGFRIPINFQYPYLARSFRDFWGRWHISLSRWFRDYLYVAFGGNRISLSRTYLNLFLVMAIAGLWHGANATFLIWGMLHGVALVLERFFGREKNKGAVWYVVVQLTLLVSWIYFRSPTVRQANENVAQLFRSPIGPVPPEAWGGVLLLLPVLILHGRQYFFERGLLPRLGWREKAVLCAVLIWSTIVAHGSPGAFLYFQF